LSGDIKYKEKIIRSFDGCEIFYVTAGDVKRPCLVFVHGIGQNHTVWRKYLENFAGEYFCVALDLRGHGKSQYKKISMDNFAEDLKAILDKEKIKKASFIGYSLGTQIIARLYEKEPQRIVKFALIGIFTPETFKTSQKLIFYPLCYLIRALCWLPYKLKLRRRTHVYNNYSVCDRRRISGWKAVVFPFLYVIPWKDFSGMHLLAYFDTLAAILSYAPPLDKIQVPSLALQSAEDFFISFQRTLNSLKQNPFVVLDYIDCDHLIIRRKPEEVCEKIRNFLS